MKNFKIMIIFIFLLNSYIYVSNITLIPTHIVLINDEKYEIKKFLGVDTVETVKTSTETENTVDVSVTLFGQKVKDVKIDTIENVEVVPIGKIVGLKLYTNGVLIVGMSDIENFENNLVNPASECNIKQGDTILKINDEEIDSIQTLKQVVNESNGENLLLTLSRDGTIFTSSITPVKTDSNEYKLGLWVKDAATGVGTITYYEPQSGSFAALGHGIIDGDTDQLINIDSGELVTSDVVSIKKGEINNPGEVRGTILNQKDIGIVSKNTKFGIYGNLTNLAELNINNSNKIRVASRGEIKIGKAKLLCCIDGKNTEEYDIEIEKIYKENNYDNKSMLIKVIDQRLIDKTGGIIRGLSGSPIIQDGKFIGSITNVLISNPKVGYAIFGDLMIKEMKK